MTNGMLYFVTTEEGRYVMTAPMYVLISYLGLHADAVWKIEKETVELGAKCKLYLGEVYLVERLEAAIPHSQENHSAKS